MSISEDAIVSIILADYAVADASQKVNILGAGWQVTGVTPGGLTPAQALVVLVEVPARYRGDQFSLAATLLNDAGDPVMVPDPHGATPETQALRVEQLIQVESPSVPGADMLEEMPSHIQMIVFPQGGLPLFPGKLYRWEVEIDGNRNRQWRRTFYVADPPVGTDLD